MCVDCVNKGWVAPDLMAIDQSRYRSDRSYLATRLAVCGTSLCVQQLTVCLGFFSADLSKSKLKK